MNGKGEMTDLVRMVPSSLHKKHTEFLKDGDVFKKHHHLFGKHQGLFAAWECVKTKPRPYEPKDSIVHVLTYPPVCKSVYVRIGPHTVASGHTYIRIELHVRTHEPARIYVIVSGSVISDSLSMGDKGRITKARQTCNLMGFYL